MAVHIVARLDLVAVNLVTVPALRTLEPAEIGGHLETLGHRASLIRHARHRSQSASWLSAS